MQDLRNQICHGHQLMGFNHGIIKLLSLHFVKVPIKRVSLDMFQEEAILFSRSCQVNHTSFQVREGKEIFFSGCLT